MHAMELMTNEMRKNKDFTLNLLYGKGVSHHHLCFGRDSKGGRKWESCIVEKKGGVEDTLIGGCQCLEKP